MRNRFLPSLAALFAGLNVSFAADEQKPGEAAPGLRSTQVSPEHTMPRLPEAKQLNAEAAKALEELGTKVFGVKWGEKIVAVSDRGFNVVTDGVTTLSYRPAGNAYFLQRKGKDHAFEHEGFAGPSEKLSARGESILSELGIERSEIAAVQILQHFVTAGEADPASGRLNVEKPQSERRTLVIGRAVEGMPVWNSRLKLDIGEKGEFAALELSWPKIEPKVMETARRLKKLESDFKAPERPGAKVESVQAGILHSPAASFIDEQVAAFRVIYAAPESGLGMKPMIYLGADGKPGRASPARCETRGPDAGTSTKRAPAAALKTLERPAEEKKGPANRLL